MLKLVNTNVELVQQRTGYPVKLDTMYDNSYLERLALMGKFKLLVFNEKAAKLIDEGKEQYLMDKLPKIVQKKIKEVQIKSFISQNDLDRKIKDAHKFLQKGHPVRLVYIPRTRQTEVEKEKFTTILGKINAKAKSITYQRKYIANF